jgi:hypothetical protein
VGFFLALFVSCVPNVVGVSGLSILDILRFSLTFI